MGFTVLSFLGGLPLWCQALLAFVAFVVIYGYKPVQRWKLRYIPGPTPEWFMGNIRTQRKLSSHMAHTLWSKMYGPIFTSWGGSQPFVIVTDPLIARQVLLLNNNRPNFRSIWHGKEREFDDASILATRGDKHRSLRGAWQPVFFSGSLEIFAALMNEATDLLLANLRAAAEKHAVINVHKAMGNMTMDVVGSAAFGVQFHTQDGDKEDSKETAEARALMAAVDRMFNVNGLTFSWYGPFVLFFPALAPIIQRVAAAFPDKGLIELRKSRGVIVNSVKHLISEQRQKLAEEAACKERGVSPAPQADKLALRRGVAPGSFLDLLMRAVDKTTDKGFSDVEIANQAFVMLLAGYETTANALSFTVYLLSNNKDKEAKMLEEIDRFGRNRKPTYADLESFPYVDAVLKESLRMFPPAPTIIREAQRDTMLGPYAVRKGQWLAVSAYAMHHDDKYWQDPESFIPERFVEGTKEAAARPLNSWMPFGDGTRACIGLRFAREEALITLIRVYQHFTFDLEPGQVPLELRSTITISPKKGVMCTVRPRTEE